MEKKLVVSLIMFILICIAIWFQVNFINVFTFFGVSANLAIVIICGIGLLSGKAPGALVGTVYGILLDLLFGKSFGVYLALYGLLGFAAGELSRGFSKDNKMSMYYMVAIFTVITEVITNLLFVLIYPTTALVLANVPVFTKILLFNSVNLFLKVPFDGVAIEFIISVEN